LLHQRSWSTLAQIATDQGRVYFKAPAPAYHHEAVLTAALARLRPAETSQLVAIEPDQGWLLMRDAGSTLRQVAPTAADQISHWEALLPRYAELQMATVDHVPALLALGVPDRRLSVLPQLYSELLTDRDALQVGREGGLSDEEHQQLTARQAQVATWCTELASYGLPTTLTHEEVHDVNVLFNHGQYTFIDWSDSSVAHPLFSILVTLRAAAYRLQLTEDGPEIRRVRDSYLEPWSRWLPRAELLNAFTLAYRLGMINRALSWRTGTARLAMQHKAPYLDAVPGWLQDFLAASLN
jgi:hypothetical protein